MLIVITFILLIILAYYSLDIIIFAETNTLGCKYLANCNLVRDEDTVMKDKVPSEITFKEVCIPGNYFLSGFCVNMPSTIHMEERELRFPNFHWESSKIDPEPLNPIKTEPLNPIKTEPLNPIKTEPLNPIKTEPLDEDDEIPTISARQYPPPEKIIVPSPEKTTFQNTFEFVKENVMATSGGELLKIGLEKSTSYGSYGPAIGLITEITFDHLLNEVEKRATPNYKPVRDAIESDGLGNTIAGAAFIAALGAYAPPVAVAGAVAGAVILGTLYLLE